MMPPAGRKALRVWRRVTASTTRDAEEVDFDKEVIPCEWVFIALVMRRGRRDGNAESVAIVKSRFAVRRHDLKRLMSVSGSST